MKSRTQNIGWQLIGSLMVAFMVGAMSLPVHATGLSHEEIANLKGPDRQQILEDGARKEGRVTYYSSMIVDQAVRPLLKAFEAKYPFIRTGYWRGNTRGIYQKVMAEMRAGALVGDVLEGSGLPQYMAQANVAQSFYSPEMEANPKEYVDPEGTWVSSVLYYFGTAYNTALVPPEEAPKKYEDLLDPKWKSRIAWRVDSESGAELFITNLRIAWGEERAEDYLRKLSQQNVVNYSGSARALVDQLIAGEYPIAINIFLHHPIISAQRGAPAASVPMNPVPVLNSTIALPKGVPNPHAAMLLIDFIMSEDGQNIFRDALYFAPHPDVLPVNELQPVVPQIAGVSENFVAPEKLIKYQPGSQQLYNKYFR